MASNTETSGGSETLPVTHTRFDVVGALVVDENAAMAKLGNLYFNPMALDINGRRDATQPAVVFSSVEVLDDVVNTIWGDEHGFSRQEASEWLYELHDELSAKQREQKRTSYVASFLRVFGKESISKKT